MALLVEANVPRWRARVVGCETFKAATFTAVVTHVEHSFGLRLDPVDESTAWEARSIARVAKGAERPTVRALH